MNKLSVEDVAALGTMSWTVEPVDGTDVLVVDEIIIPGNGSADCSVLIEEN